MFITLVHVNDLITIEQMHEAMLLFMEAVQNLHTQGSGSLRKLC